MFRHRQSNFVPRRRHRESTPAYHARMVDWIRMETFLDDHGLVEVRMPGHALSLSMIDCAGCPNPIDDVCVALGIVHPAIQPGWGWARCPRLFATNFYQHRACLFAATVDEIPPEGLARLDVVRSWGFTVETYHNIPSRVGDISKTIMIWKPSYPAWWARKDHCLCLSRIA